MTGSAPPQVVYAQPAQTNRDAEHLRLLSIFHYVLAGIMALFGCMPFIHVTLGILMVRGALQNSAGSPPPPAMGWIFVVMGSVFILMAWTVVILLLVAAGRLRRRTHRTFCFVVAGISCLFMPMGTVLGVFTILVLSRATVKTLFETAARPA